MRMAFRSLVLLVLIVLGVSEISCKVQFGPGATISNDAVIEGDVTIGAGTIVSPGARIIAQAGPIIIGEGDVIDTNVVIVNRIYGHTQIIGNGNVFGSGSTCEAFSVGDGNVFGSNCFVGQRVQLSNGCIIESGCHFTHQGYVPQGSIITGYQCRYRESIDNFRTYKQVNSTYMPNYQVFGL